MSASIIDGKAIAQETRERIKGQVSDLTFQPGLAVVQVGDDPASSRYVSHKQKDCEKVGIFSEKHHLPETTSQSELLNTIQGLNDRSEIHGILVQLPLPDGLDSHEAINAIDPRKDVDGCTTTNLGELVSGNERLVPCTPRGTIAMIEGTGTTFEGKTAVVIGRSILVGKPVALLMLNRHAVVTLCHSRTPDLGAEGREADILVVAAGRRGLVTGDMIKPGAVVIDVGINVVDGKLKGDVDFESAREVAGHITPVPGGVGPMTRAMLLENTLIAAKLQTDSASES
ncbi:MAG: bifunctional methylenetetrahydrofolate dehydrogenase/methenyltetrahydrofolate cyclohydrolase FolD [Planctomycetota bacterium]|jgi:methylenetetrahydrofolate dehydrogenase (NADP+)/methenyltetrahydrofolate cyclohydrolase|nr:bifunctional methylenetetrahydrofolate dehydrogenase/methenyltetrahydrofolate cyclohydrolase FolD [Planctomycetota bacterium]